MLQLVGAVAMANTSRLSGTVVAMGVRSRALPLLLLAVAGIGLLSAGVLDTSERVHDLGVMRVLGMMPWRTLTMIITSVAAIGLIAGAAGVPLGIAVHLMLPIMGRAASTDIPIADPQVYHLPVVLPLLTGGLVIVAAGAFPPAGWATRTRTAVTPRTE
ncbi:MAG TPA: FtsX-like permease family protein [Kineosporiaceae bacterium]